MKLTLNSEQDMNPLTNLKRIYFIGIGGIGMSALARYFNTQGVIVSGYDKTPTALTDSLIAEGISIHFESCCSSSPSHLDITAVASPLPNTLVAARAISKN